MLSRIAGFVVRLFVLWIITLLSGCAAVQVSPVDDPAAWISVGESTRRAASCLPVPIYWYVERQCPWLFGTIFEVPSSGGRATAVVRTSGYLYVYVDGNQVYAWPPPSTPEGRPRISPDPERLHVVDLGRSLRAGRHVLTVSAPPTGFVLSGEIYDLEGEPLAPVSSGGGWEVAPFAPTSLFDEATASSVPGGKSDPVEIGGVWNERSSVLAAADRTFADRQEQRDRAEALWRLDLLKESGIYVVDGAAHGGDSGRVLAPRFARQLQDLESELSNGAEATEIVAKLRRLSQRVFAADEALALRMLASEIGTPPRDEDDLDSRARRSRLTAELGHPANFLNQSRYDRLGWVPIGELVDNDPSRWGVSFGQPRARPPVRVPARWRYSSDPNDRGIAERRWAADYNADLQWPQILLAGAAAGWLTHGPVRDYAGVGWYRTTLYVADEWAGAPMAIWLETGGRPRLWWNGGELEGVRDRERWRFDIDPRFVGTGAMNSVAVRVDAPRGVRRGLLGVPFVGARGDWAEAPPALAEVEVRRSPYSPVVRLEARTRALAIRHRGPIEIGWWDGSSVRWELDYDRARDGPLETNWILLRSAASAGGTPLAPIQLIFEYPPAGVSSAGGATRVDLGAPGRRVLAVRPFGDRTVRRGDEPDLTRLVSFWSRAALALPTDYMSVTRVVETGGDWRRLSIDDLAAGPLLEQTVIYHYAESRDSWGTEPLRIAPLPPLASYAIERSVDGFVHDDAAVVQHAGSLARYRAAPEADRIRYRYRVEPFPRLAGFTAWMFSPDDAGVPGNARELELLATTGANSFRAQHNWSDEVAARPTRESRTRVGILADACRAAGMSYMNNIDQTLGLAPERLREDYAAFVDLLDEHYRRLVPQLASRPFFEVAFDLVNEPFHHGREQYNRAIAGLVGRIRQMDRRHLLFIEPPASWSGLHQLAGIRPTGDPLTVHSFHDYQFRLEETSQRWPTVERDVSNIYRRWLPAFVHQIDHGVPLHCGEFGNFTAEVRASSAVTVLLNDLFRVLDQFGMHHHYYSGRHVFLVQADGSVLPTEVARAYETYFQRRDFNHYYRR